jgi:hypothetical protein
MKGTRTMSNVFQSVKKAMSGDGKDPMILIAIAIGILCLFICGIFGALISHKAEDKFITLLIQLAGMACGAFLGFLASPKAKGEQVAFLTFAKAISAFLSGYALSKINHLVDTLFQGDIYKDQLVVARLLIFFIGMIISFMIAYSHRAYVQKIPAQDDTNKQPQKEDIKVSG